MWRALLLVPVARLVWLALEAYDRGERVTRPSRYVIVDRDASADPDGL